MRYQRPTKAELQKIYDERYETGFFLEEYFTGFNGLSSQIIELTKDDITGKVVLDAGCGAGRLALLAAQFAKDVDGVDLNKKAIELAKIVADCTNLTNVNFFVADLERMSLRKNYDVIFYSETIEHVDEPLKSLRNLKRLLKTGGKLVISCPNFQNLRGYSYMSFLTLFKLLMSPSDRREISPRQLITWCEKANLKLITFAGTLYERGWGEVCVKDMVKRVPLAVRDSDLPKNLKEEIKYEDYNAWLADASYHAKKLIKYLVDLKILRKRKNIARFTFRRPTYLKDDKLWERIKFYLRDGDQKENLYYTTAIPWNFFGAGSIVVAQNS